MLDTNLIPTIDSAIAKFLMLNRPYSDELFALFCHLSQAVRAGHLCIQVNDQHVYPLPQSVWEVSETLTQDDWIALENLIKTGMRSLSEEVYPLILHQDCLYFEKYWTFESSCHEHLQQLLQNKPTFVISEETIEHELKKMQTLHPLMSEQLAAIKQLTEQSLTLICGGPGTGKTYTAGLLVKAYWNCLSPEQRNQCKIALAAPTGKAAANLQKSFENATKDLSNFQPLTAKTLHTLLGLKSKNPENEVYLNFDLLIVDECSMIDIKVMSKLLKSLKPGARLILLGDPYQLPSVEAGAFFADMCHICQFPHLIELKCCLRTDLQEIVDLANAIKQGDCKAALQQLHCTSDHLHLHALSEEESLLSLQKALWEKAGPTFCNINSETTSLKEFCILSALRKGPLGADQLNTFFAQEIFKKLRGRETVALPIMITVNDSKKELFNGDMGVLIKSQTQDASLNVGDYAIFSGRRIPALLLPQFEYAFCLSVHKSQGSEFDHVIFVIPDGAESFGREMVYTAVTRARKNIEIWSSPETFNQVLQNSSQRLSRVTVAHKTAC